MTRRGKQGFGELVGNLERRIEGVRPGLLPVCLAILFFVVPLVDGYTQMYGDLSEYVNGGYRVFCGERPYIDFWCLHPPGEVYFPAVMFRLFGGDVNAVLIATLFVSMLVGLTIYRIAKSVTGSPFWATAAAVIAYFNGITFYRKFTYIHAGFLLLAFAYSMWAGRTPREQAGGRAFVCGLLMGGALLFRSFEVIPVLGAFCMATLTAPDFDPSARFKTVALWASGIAASLLLMALVTQPFFEPMIRQVFLRSLAHGTGYTRPYFYAIQQYLARVAESLRWMDFSDAWRALPGGLYYAMKSVYALAYHLLPFGVTGLCIGTLRSRRLSDREKFNFVFLLSWGILATARPLIQSGFWQLSYGNTPFLILLVLLLRHRMRSGWRSGRGLRGVGDSAIAALTVIHLVFAVIAAGHKASLPLFQRYRVTTANGSIRYGSSGQAHDVSSVFRFIENHTREGDFIFATPWFAPPFYALSGRRNATYYDSLVDFFHEPPEEKIRGICADLEKKDARLIVHAVHLGFGPPEPSESLPLLGACIEGGYSLAARFGPYRVYRKNMLDAGAPAPEPARPASDGRAP